MVRCRRHVRATIDCNYFALSAHLIPFAFHSWGAHTSFGLPVRAAAGRNVMSHASEATTHPRPGFAGRWLFSTNHKDIGTLYLLLSMLSGILGTGLSVALRMELQEPGMQIFSDPGVFNVVVSAHGLVMIFFVIMPALIGGFGNWFIPIMIGAPDMAFPRMNNVSFWLLVASLVLFILSMFVPGATGVNGHGGGWTLYPPYSSGGQPGPAVDLVILSIHLSGGS